MNDQLGTHPDVVIDFDQVERRKDGNTLVGPISWQVELDERWIILGPNGSGKTSLVRIAAAMDYPSSGRVQVLGEQLGRTDVHELRTRVGFSSSALAERIPPNETVANVVISAGYAVLGRWRERYDNVDFHRLAEILEVMGAEHLQQRVWGTLSEGEKKRVLIARALMTDPEMLILDEPAAGLDVGGREELVGRLDVLAHDPDAPTLVVITHHVEEIPPGFTHALVLSEGRAVASGLIEDVVTTDVLSSAFAQRIHVHSTDGRYFAHRPSKVGRHRK